MRDTENCFMKIDSGCLRMVPTSSEFICKKQNFRSQSEFNRLNNFQDFRIATFPLDIIIYEVKDCHLIKHINLSMYLDVGGANC